MKINIKLTKAEAIATLEEFFSRLSEGDKLSFAVEIIDEVKPFVFDEHVKSILIRHGYSDKIGAIRELRIWSHGNLDKVPATWLANPSTNIMGLADSKHCIEAYL